jgi:hypothetical protein
VNPRAKAPPSASARLFELRRAGYEIESRVEGVLNGTGRRTIKRSWFRLLTPRQLAAHTIGMNRATPESLAAGFADDSQPSLVRRSASREIRSGSAPR